MADATIEMEARLKDLVSPELAKVKTAMRETSGVSKTTSNSINDFSKQMGEATNFSKQMGIGLKTLVTSMIGAQAIIGAARSAFRGISQFVKESADEFIRYNANHPDVRRIQEIDDVWKRLQGRLGAYVVPMMRQIKEFGGAAAQAALDVIPDAKTATPYERRMRLGSELEKAEALLARVRKSMDEGTYKGSIDSASKALTILEQRIDSLNAEINKTRPKAVGESGFGGTTGYGTSADIKANEEAAKDRAAARAKAIEDAERLRIEQERKDLEVAQELEESLDRQRELNDAKIAEEQRLAHELSEAHEKEMEEARQYYKDMTALAEARAAGVTEANYALVDSVTGAAKAILDISESSKEDLKPVYIGIAIVEGIAAAARAVKLAVDESSTTYEAVAKSAAAIITYGAITAANVATISSAATGADFVADKPQLLMVGDNPTQRERVQVTPLGSPNTNGPQGNGGSGGDVYNFYGITDDRLIDSLRSLKRAGKLATVLG